MLGISTACVLIAGGGIYVNSIRDDLPKSPDKWEGGHGLERKEEAVLRDLEAAPDSYSFVTALQREVGYSSQILESVVIDQKDASSTNLGVVYFHVSMRGSYIGSREVLGALLSKFPQATIHSLRWMSVPVSQEGALSMELAIWRPALDQRSVHLELR